MPAVVNPPALGQPKCQKCDAVMRLIGIERDPDNPRMSLHTFECVCGEFAVSRSVYQ